MRTHSDSLAFLTFFVLCWKMFKGCLQVEALMAIEVHAVQPITKSVQLNCLETGIEIRVRWRVLPTKKVWSFVKHYKYSFMIVI